MRSIAFCYGFQHSTVCVAVSTMTLLLPSTPAVSGAGGSGVAAMPIWGAFISSARRPARGRRSRNGRANTGVFRLGRAPPGGCNSSQGLLLAGAPLPFVQSKGVAVAGGVAAALGDPAPYRTGLRRSTVAPSACWGPVPGPCPSRRRPLLSGGPTRRVSCSN